VRVGHFEKFLKMIFGRPCLALEVTFSCHDTLLARVAGFLIAATVISYNGDAMGSSLLPFLTTLGALAGTLNGGLGWFGSATISGRVCVASDEGGPDCLLAKGVSICDVEQLLGIFQLLTIRILNQGVACHAIPKSHKGACRCPESC
jgi:hypothetical protein